MNAFEDEAKEILSAHAKYSMGVERQDTVLHGMTSKEALSSLTALFDAEVLQTEKAYGGCRLCFGKGFATVRKGETYHGATHNIRTQMKFCTCERGKQLTALFDEGVKAAQAEYIQKGYKDALYDVGYGYEPIKNIGSVEDHLAMFKRLAELSAQSGEEKK